MRKDLPKAEDYLKERKWKQFLLAIPVGKPTGYPFLSASDLNTIRVRAAQLNGDATCDRRFSVNINFDTSVATITATYK